MVRSITKVVTYRYRGSFWLGYVARSGANILIGGHSDLSKDLAVDFFAFLLSTRVLHHVEGVSHHFLLHAHLLRLLGEFFHNLLHLLRVHGAVHCTHDFVDVLQTLHHRCVHLRCRHLVHDHAHLARHCVVHLHLLSRSDQIF